jgi:hypothetical protein
MTEGNPNFVEVKYCGVMRHAAMDLFYTHLIATVKEWNGAFGLLEPI